MFEQSRILTVDFKQLTYPCVVRFFIWHLCNFDTGTFLFSNNYELLNIKKAHNLIFKIHRWLNFEAFWKNLANGVKGTTVEAAKCDHFGTERNW